jgi:hypothetical protein
MDLAARASKFHARKTVVDGIQFDSAKEAKRYVKLRDMQEAGEIDGLRLQVPFELIPAFKLNGKAYMPTTYVADFVYLKDGEQVVEDVKSPATRTRTYMLKKKLMAYVQHIEIKEV